MHLLGMWMVFTVSALVVTWFTLQMTRAVRSRDAQLAQAREQALRDDWLISMGSLAAGAAHDLSTPLATLSLLVEEGQRHPQLPAELGADLQLMQRQISACKQALTHLTQRAGSPRGGEAVSLLPVAEWLQVCLNAWQALHPQANINCTGSEATATCQLPQDLLLERAFASLLDNAVKAQAQHINIHTRCTPGQLQIEVRDDGLGISPEALTYFESGQPYPSEKGLGIGLLLVRGTLERRGGQLTLSALPHGGSCACISLPRPVPIQTLPGA
jgi:two-component system sensor histidine kinase RegB